MAAVTAYVFYRKLGAFFFFLPLGILVPLYKKNELRLLQKERLRLQFKEAIQMLASSLSAGYSVENAFTASLSELTAIYGENGMITKEFSYFVHQLKINRTIEQLMTDFAQRSGLEEIQNFAEIFHISKRSRGELVSVVNHVVHVISGKIQVRDEIMAMNAEKKLEQCLMNLMPFGIVLYIDFSFPGFFQNMYETIVGNVIMTCCLILYIISCLLAKKILQIEI